MRYRELTPPTEVTNSEVVNQNARIAGLTCVVLGAIVFLWWGIALESGTSSRMLDFRTMYYNVRVLLNHQDPYNTLNGEHIAMDEGEKPRVSRISVPSEITCVYPPSALIVNVPLGFLRWGPAHRLWMVLNGGGLVLSGLLLWNIAAEFAPLLAGMLIGFLLANSEGLLFQGNVAGIVVSLCIVAVWCFVKDRFVIVGVLCMAASLAIKPHDSGFVWLCFLFCGPRLRKYALQALLVTALVALSSVVWVSRVAPGWTGELKANLAAVSARGEGNDPGPASGSTTIANTDINLQSVFAVIEDEPAFYNPLSYATVGVLLAMWLIAMRRIPLTPLRLWIAMAFLSALTMLPVYHRHHDAKLLLLAVPACAMIWVRNRSRGIAALLITLFAVAMISDVPRAILTRLESSIPFSYATASGKFFMILLARPAPLAILLMSIFFLWLSWIELPEKLGDGQ